MREEVDGGSLVGGRWGGPLCTSEMEEMQEMTSGQVDLKFLESGYLRPPIVSLLSRPALGEYGDALYAYIHTEM